MLYLGLVILNGAFISLLIAHMAKINKRIFYNKQTDKTEIRFYFGTKKATEEQRREYIKNNFNDVDRSQLSKEDSAYYGRVLGGKNRASEAARIDGKYIYKQFVRKNKIDHLAHLRGFKNAKELFEKDKNYYEQAKKLYYAKNGLEYTYNSDGILNALSAFTGKIFINGKAVTILKAIEKTDKADKEIKRKYGNFLNIFTVRYKKGGAELHLRLPSSKQIKDVGDTIEEFEEEFGEDIEILDSPQKGKEAPLKTNYQQKGKTKKKK